MTDSNATTNLLDHGQAMLAKHNADPSTVNAEAMIKWLTAFYNQATDEQRSTFERQVSDKAKAEAEAPKTITIEAETAAAADSLTRVGSEIDRIYGALFNIDACLETMALITEHRDNDSDGISWEFAVEELRRSAKKQFHTAIELAGDLNFLFEWKLKFVEEGEPA